MPSKARSIELLPMIRQQVPLKLPATGSTCFSAMILRITSKRLKAMPCRLAHSLVMWSDIHKKWPPPKGRAPEVRMGDDALCDEYRVFCKGTDSLLSSLFLPLRLPFLLSQSPLGPLLALKHSNSLKHTNCRTNSQTAPHSQVPSQLKT